MSPGVTFERVYHELKKRLADGTFKPGQPIEPAVMSAELAASITPIRDALHRLVGERLVEAPNHNGFRVPRPSEAELRDLYLWNGRVLGLAIQQIRVEALGDVAAPLPGIESIAAATADLFLRVASASGSNEHARAIAALNDRLAPFRRIEAHVLDGLAAEFSSICAALKVPDRAWINRILTRHRQRRATAVPAILTVLVEND